MDKPVILSEETISAAFAGTNFGGAEKSDEGRRGLMVECLLKRVAGFSDGHMIITICRDTGLLNSDLEPSREGLRWAFDQLYVSGGPTIVERLNRRNLDRLVGRQAFVAGSCRVVTLTKLIRGERWLCTDDIGKCHPCYNLSDLRLLPPNKP